MRKLKFADLFCGAGGTSHGAERSGAADVVFALNHWDRAIATHSLNHTNAKHVNSRLDMVNPSECPRIDGLFASPKCTGHSNARGGCPTTEQDRADAWDVLKWVEHHRPSFVVIENVREFKKWGPLDRNGRPLKSMEGKYFDSWLMALRAGGYRVEHHLLNAANYGANTSRTRLIIIARKGNRDPIFPEPTRSFDGAQTLFGKLPKWGTAAEIIDWSIPCPSIFARPRPLKDKTLRRIEIGLRKFVGAYLVKMRGTGTAVSIDEPMPTITAGGLHNGLAIPFVMSQCSGGSPRSIDHPVPTLLTGGTPSLAIPYIVQWDQQSGGGGFSSIGDPLGTIVTKANRGVAVPYLVQVNHGDKSASDSNRRVNDLGEPIGTITTSRSHGVAVPFLSSYYGSGDAQSIDEPLDTVTTLDRHSLIVPHLGTLDTALYGDSPAMASLLRTMAELGVADIGFRMLWNQELALAQGFDRSFQFTGTKKEVTCQIGNSVSPPLAEQITLALAG